MKRILFSLTALLSCSALWAQSSGNNSGMEYLLDGSISVSAFGGPIVEFSSLGDDMAVSSGGGGALLLNQQLFVGGYGLSSGEIGDSGNERFTLDHGGFWLGYLNSPDDMVHWGITAKLGWGEANTRIGGTSYSDNVFVISPEAIVEFNIARWFKINVGGGYHLVTGLGGENGLAPEEFNKPAFTVNFLFGWFD